MIKITGCTNYFKNKWIDVFGTDPSIEQINKDIQHSVLIQSFGSHHDRKNRKYIKESQKSIQNLVTLWIPSLDRIIKIDEKSCSAITFYTPNDARQHGNVDAHFKKEE